MKSQWAAVATLGFEQTWSHLASLNVYHNFPSIELASYSEVDYEKHIPKSQMLFDWLRILRTHYDIIVAVSVESQGRGVKLRGREWFMRLQEYPQ